MGPTRWMTAAILTSLTCGGCGASDPAEGGSTPDASPSPGGEGGAGGEATGGTPTGGSTGGSTGGAGGEATGGTGGGLDPDAGVSDCVLPETIDSEVIIGSACPPIATAGVTIVGGGRLRLDPGVVLRFGDGALLTINGGGALDVRGTEAAPVVLEGQTAAPGSWQGLFVRAVAEATATVNLSHAAVRHGGFSGPDALGCMTVVTSVSPHVLSVTDTVFADCGTYGVLIPTPGQDFAAFTDVSFTGTETALSLHADVVGSIPPGVGLEADARLQLRGGTVEHSQTWVPQSVPWHVDVAIAVGGPNAPELTLAPGLELVMGRGVDVLVGATPGGIRASGARFTAGPNGPWGGIAVLEGATAGVFEGVEISGTGGPGSPGFPVPAGVFVQGDGATTRIVDSVFSENVVDILLACGGAAELSGNSATIRNGDGCR